MVLGFQNDAFHICLSLSNHDEIIDPNIICPKFQWVVPQTKKKQQCQTKQRVLSLTLCLVMENQINNCDSKMLPKHCKKLVCERSINALRNFRMNSEFLVFTIRVHMFCF